MPSHAPAKRAEPSAQPSQGETRAILSASVSKSDALALRKFAADRGLSLSGLLKAQLMPLIALARDDA